MKYSLWPLLGTLLAGCVDNQISLVVVQNQVIDRMGGCVVSSMASNTVRGKGILDVGLVADGYQGYEMYPLVRNNLLDRSSPMSGVPQRNIIEVQGADVELITGTLSASLPAAQSTFFAPGMGGALEPNGGEAPMTFTAIPRGVALMLGAGVTGTEPDFPTVTVKYRIRGTHQSDTGSSDIFSGYVQYPVQLCRYCLTGGKPPTCPTPPQSAQTVNLGSCNVSQDDYVTCCYEGALKCGPLVPVTTGN
jgi:hypothetical protein